MKPLLSSIFDTRKNRGILTIAYALLAEALLIGYVVFAGFFTLETLLPTFISVRLSLTGFLATLATGTLILALLGRRLGLDFASGLRRRNPLVILGLLWAVGILTISLIKFPPFLIPIIILALLAIGYLFLLLFSEGKD